MRLDKKLLRLQKELGLDSQSMVRLKNAAAQAQRIENDHKQRTRAVIEKVNREIAQSLATKGIWTRDLDRIAEDALRDMVFVHAYESMLGGLATAMDGERTTRANLAKPPKGRMPRSFKDLMEAWRSYRKTKKIPKKFKPFFSRAEADAERIKKEYLKKTRGAFERYSRDHRAGKEFSQGDIVKKIEKASGSTRAHASTIVNTETTYYYNKTRRDYYDQSEDVVAYLFVPIRDAATTKWCSSRRNTVYLKGSKYLEKETPPIHWNCRSELLPLTMQNPSHLRLIEDKSLRRENRRPARLHPKWVA